MQNWLFFNVFPDCSDDFRVSWLECLLHLVALVFFWDSHFWMLLVHSSFIYLGKFFITEIREFSSFTLLHLHFLVLIEIPKSYSSWLILLVLIHHFFLDHWIPESYGHFSVLEKIAVVVMAINHFLYFSERLSILSERLFRVGRIRIFLGANNDHRLPYFGIFIFGLV